MAHLSAEDQHRVRDAIKAAEATTAGEIVCVLARASSDYMSYATAWSALIALIMPWFMIALTNFSVHEIFLAQIVIFVVLFLILSESPLRRFLIPRAARRAEAHRAAMEQFMIRGMARKQNRAGVLIFVSLAERYARIVADDGIASKLVNPCGRTRLMLFWSAPAPAKSWRVLSSRSKNAARFWPSISRPKPMTRTSCRIGFI